MSSMRQERSTTQSLLNGRFKSQQFVNIVLGFCCFLQSFNTKKRIRSTDFRSKFSYGCFVRCIRRAWSRSISALLRKFVDFSYSPSLSSILFSLIFHFDFEFVADFRQVALIHHTSDSSSKVCRCHFPRPEKKQNILISICFILPPAQISSEIHKLLWDFSFWA